MNKNQNVEFENPMVTASGMAMNPSPQATNPSRRGFLQLAAATAGSTAFASTLPTLSHLQARDKVFGPLEKSKLTLGFIALTDCASVVMAYELGLFAKYGLEVTLSKQPSWAAIRDRVTLGELDAAHMLYGLVYGVHLGIGGPHKDMAILMGLNHNGQGIVLSNQLRDQGAIDGPSLKKLIDRKERSYTFAQTFPTGTHAMWLYYWLAAAGIDPLRDVKVVTVSPPQMVASMRCGKVDGYCGGEPWGGARAIHDGIGFTATTTQAIWRNHPEKVLGTTQDFAARHPNTARALVAAILEASHYIDMPGNRDRVAAVISDPRYVNAPTEIIAGRLRGEYENGLGRKWQDPDYMKFHNDGDVNYPYLSHGMWFLSQQQRWGMLEQNIDHLALARQVNQIDLYEDAARSLGIPLPPDPMKAEMMFDGVVWDPSRPSAFLDNFSIKA